MPSALAAPSAAPAAPGAPSNARAALIWSKCFSRSAAAALVAVIMGHSVLLLRAATVAA